MKTLLARAKGSPLTIIASHTDPIGTVLQLPPHTKQITALDFSDNLWEDIQRFSEINSGPLPLLRTLNINAIQGIDPDGPLFNGAVDLTVFRLHSARSLSLSHFVFPNLTSFDLAIAEELFRGSQLLDFLEASPMLQAVRMKIIGPISLQGIPQERVVVLHRVESFCLAARDGSPGYELAAHVSCPSAKHTSLTHIHEKEYYFNTPQENFPASASWKAIISQYTRTPIEEIVFETKADSDYFIVSSLTFRSADTTTIRLRSEVSEENDDSETSLWRRSFTGVYHHVLSEASRTIRDLPLLANVKRVHMCGPLDLGQGWIESIATEIGELFKSLGPLEELTISHCDIRPYTYPFPHFRETPGLNGLIVYPPIGVLTISHPSNMLNEDVTTGLVKLARVQHELGVPFERVAVRVNGPPEDMEERLRPWVGAADCCSVS